MSYASEVLADSPGAWFRLGDSSGTAAVDAIGGASGTYVGGFTLAQPSLLLGDAANTAVLFAAASRGYVRVASRTGVNPGDTVTVEAWIYMNTLAAMVVIDKGANGFILRVESDGIVTWRRNNVGNICQSRVRLAARTLYHVVATKRAAAEQKIYINGVDQTGTVTNQTLTTTTTELDIGAADTGGNGWFNGIVDEPAVYPTSLSAARVLAHYTAGITRPASTVTGAATLTGLGSLDARGTRTALGASTATGSGQLAAAGVRTALGAVTLPGTGAVAATGVRTGRGAAGLAGSGALTGAGVRQATASATMVGTGTLTASGVRTARGSVQLTGSGTLVAVGSGSATHTGSATLTGTGSLAADGVRTAIGTVTLSAAGTMAASGVRTAVGSATLNATGTLTASGARVVLAAATLTGFGTLTAAGSDSSIGPGTILIAVSSATVHAVLTRASVLTTVDRATIEAEVLA